jgi:hypothetical protein
LRSSEPDSRSLEPNLSSSNKEMLKNEYTN